jgi:hypothetical protein
VGVVTAASAKLAVTAVPAVAIVLYPDRTAKSSIAVLQNVDAVRSELDMVFEVAVSVSVPSTRIELATVEVKIDGVALAVVADPVAVAPIPIVEPAVTVTW